MMRFASRAAVFAAAVSLLSAGWSATPARAEGPAPIALHVDASRAVQGWINVHETIPVRPGPLTLQYPKWIPGEHAPSGPVENLSGVVLTASGKKLAWTRDLVDMYALHVDVPTGVSMLDADFVFLGANGGNYSDARLATPNLLSLTWNKLLLTPKVDDYGTQMIAPTLTLPGADWKYATALETASQHGAVVTFNPVSQEQLVDSPLDAGINERTWDLGRFDGVPVSLAAFADMPSELNADPKAIAALQKLVEQMHALYRYRHFGHYTFLLTLSDVMPGEGVEHHQSSDDGTAGKFLVEHDAFLNSGDLLAHEWNHSWNGKYRRPFDLATRNLQDPMKDDLLWVYEGMTQFYGNLQAERAGIFSQQDWLDMLASTYASLDTQRGRDWRPLLDTASAAPTLYSAPRAWSSSRRGVDFYNEGMLMWLEADVLIRTLSHGQHSIDDVARAFFGNGADTGPQVVTYTRDDLIAALNAVQPYDWASFFRARVDEVASHPPDPFTAAGYQLAFSDKQTQYAKTVAGQRHVLDLRYSLGITARSDGTIVDVVQGSPAFSAGLGPGEKIVAVNDRALTDGQIQLDDALRAAQSSGTIRLLLTAGDVYRATSIAYRGGPRYPRLERVAGKPDVLTAIATPLAP